VAKSQAPAAKKKREVGHVEDYYLKKGYPRQHAEQIGMSVAYRNAAQRRLKRGKSTGGQ
jgi:hypothetical protein